MDQTPRAVVCVSNEAVRAAIMAELHDIGFLAVSLAEVALLRPLLRVSPRPLVVLLAEAPDSAGHPDRQEVRTVLREIGALPPHAYVLLSTISHQATTRIFNPHTRRLVPVLASPVDMQTLRTCTADTAEQLAAVVEPLAQPAVRCG